jgi:RNA polymerase sigma factor (TIGR02999 family)
MPFAHPLEDVPSGAVTELLRAWQRGEHGAQDRLLPVVYAELRRQAESYLRRERSNHTLVATAVVHEAYLRLVGQHVPLQNRAQFFGLMAQMMRRVLIDHARARAAGKRPRPELQLALDSADLGVAPPAFELLELDRALTELAAIDPRKARLVELRYFGGFTASETADLLEVSLTTFKRDWNVARAWLFRYLTRSPS